MTRARLPARFQLLGELGRGGMGAVYEAVDTERGGRVAIKMLPSDDQLAIARFKREFRSLQDIHHPNLVALGELFCEDGQWGFSMDLIDGMDLLEWVRPRRVSAFPDRVFDEVTLGLPADEGIARERSENPPADGAAGAIGEGSRPTVVAPPSAPPPSNGVAASQPPRAPVRFDEARLRDAFAQLTRGLDALHSAHKVHRDVKPANVRVRADGQLFLLDFGIVAELAADGGVPREESAIGTPEFMAPEQAAGAEASAAADWYSVGVALFAVLTGDLPFTGTVPQMLMAKQSKEAPRVRELVPDAPEDLDQLCARLLHFDPKKRPQASEILRILSSRSGSEPRIRTADTQGSAVKPFVGRAVEFSSLIRAFRATQAGGCAAVVLEGESGVGKSFLAKQFLDMIRAEHPETVVVAGRCFENEAVPYNAWDSTIDALGARWMTLDPAKAAELLPTHVAPLVQTFPALRLVPAVARAHTSRGAKIDPRETRTRAFAALREVFLRFAQRTPVVLFIDDLQWADHDSVSLLAEVLREPDAPPLLFLATARPLDHYPDVALELSAALPRGADRHAVSELPHSDAVSLARHLLGDTPGREDEAESIASEAKGHALFIAELARHVASTGRARRGALSLAQVLRARVGDLALLEQNVVKVLAVAARPLPEIVVLRAAQVPPEAGSRLLQGLRVAHLTRSTRVDGTDRLETYHDRIREAVAESVPAEERVATYERLALALETTRYADPNMLTEFWRAAGNLESAGHHAKLAGDRACAALAFDRAAEFYAIAVKRPSLSDSERHDLLTLLGDTLAKAGRGKDAADVYQQTLSSARSKYEALGLEQKASEQLLRTGHHDPGIALAKRVFDRARLPWPRGALGCLLQLLLLKAFLALRGRKFRERAEREIPRDDLIRLDVCFAVGSALLFSDTLRANAIQVQHLVLALRAGELARVSVALSLNGFQSAATKGSGGERRALVVAKVARDVEAVAARAGSPYERAYADITIGASFAVTCRAAEGLRQLQRGEARLRDECSGRTTELVAAQVWTCRCYFFLGEFEQLATYHAGALSEARDRRDLFGTTNLRLGFCSMAWLVRDDPAAAQRELDLGLADCRTHTFSVEKHYGLAAAINIALYVGDPDAALAALNLGWPRLRSSHLRQIMPPVRFQASEYRSRVHLACARRSTDGRTNHLALAREWADDAARADSGYAPPLTELLRAQLRDLMGDDVGAAEHLRRAIPALVAMDLHGYAAVARRALGQLEGGAAGVELARDGETFLRAKGVANISAFCRSLAPGFVARNG